MTNSPHPQVQYFHTAKQKIYASRFFPFVALPLESLFVGGVYGMLRHLIPR